MKEKLPNIIWYGERGIVNSIITELFNTDKDNMVKNAKKLIKNIVWKNPDLDLGWINELKDVKVIVEIGLAQFGDPDIIFVVTTEKDETFCLFIEAKVSSYSESAKSNKNGMRVKGYNSSINGQISLKYRFAKALSSSNTNLGCITENKDIFNAYKKFLHDPKKEPRKLCKPYIINLLSELGLFGLPLDHFYFVVITEDPKQNSLPFDNDIIPPFYNENKQIDEIALGHIGTLTYTCILEKLLLKGNKTISWAINAMVRDEKIDENEVQLKKLTISPISSLNNELVQYTSELIDTIDEKNIDDGYFIDKLVGSYSVKEINSNKTIAKIIPFQDGNKLQIFLGSRINEISDEWIEPLEKVKVKINNVIFTGIILEINDNHDYTSAINNFCSAL